jgi:hypothetical protein
VLRKTSLRLALRRARGHQRDRGREKMAPRGSNRWCRATQPSLPVFESSALKSPGLTPSGGRHLALWPLQRRLGTNGIYGTSLDEAQPNSMPIGKDIGSRSNYPLTPMRRTAPTVWLQWTCLSPHGAKPNPPTKRQHDLLKSVGTLGKSGVGSP